MRHVLVLFGLVFCLTCIASAQTVQANPLLLAAPFTLSPSGVVSASSMSSVSGDSLNSASPPGGTLSSTPALNSSPEPQYVQGVFVTYSWQAYLGYDFFHFSAKHGISRNMNGFNWSISYFFKDWFGIEGEMIATHDNPNNQSSWFTFGGGGPRFRWQGPRGIEVFAHGLVGYSHLTPQTPFGRQEAFAYVVGGGVDFPTPFRRLSLRAGADMLGSRYYHDNQFNPNAYGGIVFKF